MTEKFDEKEVDISPLWPFDVSCETAKEINNAIKELPLDAYVEALGTPIDKIVDKLKEVSARIEAECSPDDLGKLSPSTASAANRAIEQAAAEFTK